LALYNYSTATRRTLGWVAAAGAEFRATGDFTVTGDFKVNGNFKGGER
jgi:hypothetical protein